MEMLSTRRQSKFEVRFVWLRKYGEFEPFSQERLGLARW
jgi:hypothetical protein